MLRLLLVEDDAALRGELADALEGLGHETLVAADGLEALSRLETACVDIIVADHRMPRMTGLELARRLRGHESLARIPIIMLSATNPAAHGADENIVDIFLSKPPDLDELAASIDYLAGRDMRMRDLVDSA